MITINSKNKVFAIIAFIFQTLSLILMSFKYLKGYEVSIYENIPIFSFILLFSSVIIGITMILSYLSEEQDNAIILGFIILINSLLIFFAIPIIKGYVFYDFADPFTHISYAKDILSYGQLSKDNFYPILHIWLSIISNLTGISVMSIMKHTPMFVSIFFILSIYLLNTVLFDNKKKVTFASLIATIPFVHIYYTSLTPNGLSFMLAPIILFLYFKNKEKNKIQLSILLIIFLILIPFMHPLTTIMLMVLFITIEISSKLYYIIRNKKIITNDYKISPNSILILITIFITWISSYAVFNRSFSKVFDWLNGELIAPTQSISSSFEKLNFSLFDRLILFFKTYSPDIILGILALFTIIIITKRLFSRTKNEDRLLFILSSCFATSGLMMLILLITGDPNLLPLRSLNFVFLISVPLASYCVYLLWERIESCSLKKQEIFKVLIICLISFSFISGCLAVYETPYIYKPTPGVTNAHFLGMEWFFEYKDPSLSSTRLEASVPWRFGEVIYGYESARKIEKINKYSGWQPAAPNNFGYNNYTNIANFYDEKKYFPISKYDQLAYTQVWNEYKYSKADFNRLESDNSINKIFENGDLDIWIIMDNI